MRSINPLLLLTSLLCITLSAASAVSAAPEKPCKDIVEELHQIYGKSLKCVRQNCPDFRLKDAGNTDSEKCLKGCESEAAADVSTSEPDLVRCKNEFHTTDEKDMLTIAWCMAASRAVALVVEPFSLCVRRDKCQDRDLWRSPECFQQCEADANQLVEVAASTMERCAELPQSKNALCTMLEKTINVCFIPEHCDRLVTILREHCPELTQAASASSVALAP